MTTQGWEGKVKQCFPGREGRWMVLAGLMADEILMSLPRRKRTDAEIIEIHIRAQKMSLEWLASTIAFVGQMEQMISPPPEEAAQ